MENGASLDAAAGKEKITALSDAAENGHFVICSILFEAGADPFIKDIAVSYFIPLSKLSFTVKNLFKSKILKR